MALVDYRSSDDSEEEDEEPNAQSTIHPQSSTVKRKRHDETSSELPPLPSKFHDLYASNTRVSTRDDPALHGGRTRVTPHVDGNWPTHLYIEWYPATIEHGSLVKLISKLKETIPPEKAADVNTFLTSDLGAPLPLHISLSRPIGLPTEQKDVFVTSLQQVIKSSAIRPFYIAFSDLHWVPNFDKTRWFLVLHVQKPELNSLNKLLYISNKVVQEYSQPPLYTKPRDSEDQIKPRSTKMNMKTGQNARRASETRVDWSDMQEVSDAFHISIAWTLEQPSSELLAATKSMTRDEFEEVKKMSFTVEEVKAKVGNVVTSIQLPRKVEVEKALWGD